MVTSYVIHIGPHKTGTTYLQHGFTELRPSLAQRGICYPDNWGTIQGHHVLTERLARDGGASLQAEFDQLAADQDSDTILLSSETLAYGTDAQVHRLKGLLRDSPVTIVFYFRRWSELIPSHWREVVKHGSLETLPEFALKRLANPAESEIVNFARVLGRYAKVFGADSLQLASYNAVLESGEDLLRHFCRCFLAWPDPPPIEPRRLNESLHMVDCEIIRALNALEWTRAREGRLKLFHRYMAARDTLPVGWIVDQSMQFTVNHVQIDDAAAGLAQLHDRIANQYRYALVLPCPGGRLFEPRARDVDYIQTTCLMLPGIMEKLRDMQETLRAAEGMGSRAGRRRRSLRVVAGRVRSRPNVAATSIARRGLIDLIARRYDAIVASGITFHEGLPALPQKLKKDGTPRAGRPKRRVGHNLVERLRDRKADVLRFLTNPEVPFTNNQAERDSRMLGPRSGSRLKQKISGCFRSIQGANDFTVIRTLIGTAKKQGWGIIQSLMRDPKDLIKELRTV